MPKRSGRRSAASSRTRMALMNGRCAAFKTQAVRFVLVAVELHGVDDPLADQPRGQREWSVDEHRHAPDPGGQRAQPVTVAREVERARRAVVEVQAQRVRAEFDGERGVVGMRDSANLHAHAALPGGRERVVGGKDHFSSG